MIDKTGKIRPLVGLGLENHQYTCDFYYPDNQNVYLIPKENICDWVNDR